MTDVLEVGIEDGIPVSGTGNVPTIAALMLGGIAAYQYRFLGGVLTTSVSAGGGTTLSPPAGTLLAVITAVGGSLYFTYDGSTPSSTSFHGSLTQGGSLPSAGLLSIQALKLIGTQMSVAYFG